MFAGLSENGDKKINEGFNQQTNSKLIKNKTFAPSNQSVGNQHRVVASSSTAVHQSLPSPQLLLPNNIKITAMNSEVNNSRISPVSLTDSLNLIAEDNFIEVNADEETSEHLEQGLGKLGQAWTIKPVSHFSKYKFILQV